MNERPYEHVASNAIQRLIATLNETEIARLTAQSAEKDRRINDLAVRNEASTRTIAGLVKGWKERDAEIKKLKAELASQKEDAKYFMRCYTSTKEQWRSASDGWIDKLSAAEKEIEKLKAYNNPIRLNDMTFQGVPFEKISELMNQEKTFGNPKTLHATLTRAQAEGTKLVEENRKLKADLARQQADLERQQKASEEYVRYRLADERHQAAKEIQKLKEKITNMEKFISMNKFVDAAEVELMKADFNKEVEKLVGENQKLKTDLEQVLAQHSRVQINNCKLGSKVLKLKGAMEQAVAHLKHARYYLGLIQRLTPGRSAVLERVVSAEDELRESLGMEKLPK